MNTTEKRVRFALPEFPLKYKSRRRPTANEINETLVNPVNSDVLGINELKKGTKCLLQTPLNIADIYKNLNSAVNTAFSTLVYHIYVKHYFIASK